MFKNQYQPNRQMYKEYVVKILMRGYIVRGIVLIMIAGVTCVLLIRRSPVIAVLEGITGGIILLSLLLMPDAITRSLLTQDQGIEGLPLCTIVFYEDYIALTLPRAQSSIDYALIDAVYSLKTCYVLKVNRNTYIVKKGCFVEGDESLFAAFLLDRCPNVDHLIKK